MSKLWETFYCKEPLQRALKYCVISPVNPLQMPLISARKFEAAVKAITFGQYPELLDDTIGDREDSAVGRLSKEAEEFRDRVAACVAEFEKAMDDDFNTALAFAALYNMGREINSFINDRAFVPTPAAVHVLVVARSYYQTLMDVLGLLPGEKRELGLEYKEMLQEIINSVREQVQDLLSGELPDNSSELLDLLISLRNEARRRKDYQLADQLREALKDIGIILEDTPRGTRWRLV